MKRASYRYAFAEKDIPEEDIRQLVTAGLLAPVILAAVSEQKINEARGAAHFAFDTQDYAAAVENIMLAIVAKGYAGV